MRVAGKTAMHITDEIGAGVKFLTPVELEAEREAAKPKPKNGCICRGEEYFDGEWVWFCSPSCPVHGLSSRYDVQPMVGEDRRGRKAERGKE